MQCKVINLFISKSIFFINIITYYYYYLVCNCYNDHKWGLLCRPNYIEGRWREKSKEKTKTTRFHIHTDNPIDELSNR